MTPIDLTKTITYNDLLDWRLHWIACAADHGLSDLQRANKPASEYVALYVRLKGQLSRIVWETGAMYGHDIYESEVTDAMKAMPRYKTMTEAMEKLRTAARKAAVMEGDKLVDSLLKPMGAD